MPTHPTSPASRAPRPPSAPPHYTASVRERANCFPGGRAAGRLPPGPSWAYVPATRVHPLFDIHPLLAADPARGGAMSGGLVWLFPRPPVQGLDFEVDVRGVAC